MMHGVRLWTLSCLALLLAPSTGAAAEVALRGIAIDRTMDAPPLEEVPGIAPIVRITVDAAAADDRTLARLSEIVDAYAARHVRVIAALGGVPSADGDIERWRAFLRGAAERCRGKVTAYQIGAVRGGTAPDPAHYAYLLKLGAVQLRAVDDGVLVLQGAVSPAELAWQRDVLANGIASYVDGLALSGPDSDDLDVYGAAVRRMVALIGRDRSSATVVAGPIRLPAGDAARRVLVDAALRAIGDGIDVTVFDGDAAAIHTALAGAAAVSELLGRDLVSLDERASGLSLRRNSADATAAVRHHLLYSTSALETYLIYWSALPVDLDITVRNAPTPKVRDPLTGTVSDPIRAARATQPDRMTLTLPGADHPLIVDLNFGNASNIGTSVDVRTDVLPRVEEIVARHQQAQAAQDAVLRSFIAHVRIEQHFHPSPADPAYNIITENRLFTDRSGSEWEELSFELNGARWGANRPAFPLLQPEKVLSLPLDLRLNQDYAYRLAGVDTVDGRPAYVVRFDPTESARALYRGTVWIDRVTFMRLKVQAIETKLAGPVVSNDETQRLSKVGEIDGRPVWLVDRIAVKQVILIAGRSVLIERELHLTDFSLNRPDFEQARQSARASNRIMYRDTNQGVRYLVKQGETRVVSDRLTQSATALALGVNVDPSFDYPLPIGGVDILNFNFLKRNMQLALLFGGVIAVGNVQRANLWGGRFDASVDFFGLAVKSNDDVYNAAGRREGGRVLHRPAEVGVNVGYQVTPYHKLSVHYELHYDGYFRDQSTDPAFVIPSSTATNGGAFGYEYRRRGYSLLVNDTFYRRSTWARWGSGAAFDDQAQTYEKYDAGLSKDFIFKTFHTIHFNATYFGGQHLDRFSLYQFGMFDATRMHGVPSAVRFSDLAMFRGSYSFNLLGVYRLDLFLDHARGRDASVSSAWLPVTGTGVRVNFRTPRDTILQVDFGKSFLPAIYRGAGSTVLQILLLKPL